ncbi:relaxase/mobilization nuclease domain-containing protein [Myroides sp. LJL110]
MIVRVWYSATPKRVLWYNFQKVQQNKASVLFCNNIPQNKDFKVGFQQALQWIKLHSLLNSRVVKPIFHGNVNPNPRSILSDFKGKLLIRDFMTGMGYRETPYIAFKHFDTPKEHYHIVGSRVQNNRKVVSRSYDYFKATELAKKLSEKYDLSYLKPHFSPSQTFLNPLINKNQADIKSQIKVLLGYLFERYYFMDLNSYLILLNQFNLSFTSKALKEKKLLYFVLDTQDGLMGDAQKFYELGSFSNKDSLTKSLSSKRKFLDKEVDWIGLQILLEQQIQSANSLEDLQNNLSVLTMKIVSDNHSVTSCFYLLDYHNRFVLPFGLLGQQINNRLRELAKYSNRIPRQDEQINYSFEKGVRLPITHLDPLFGFLQERHKYTLQAEKQYRNSVQKKHSFLNELKLSNKIKLS